MIFLCYRSLLLSFFIFFINKIFSQSNETEETIRYVIIVHGTINVRALKDFKKIFSLWYGRKNDLEDQYFFETINLRWQK